LKRAIHEECDTTSEFLTFKILDEEKELAKRMFNEIYSKQGEEIATL